MTPRITIDHTRMSSRRAARTKKLNESLDDAMMVLEEWIEDIFNSRNPRDKKILDDLLTLAQGGDDMKILKFADDSADDEPKAIAMKSATKRDEWARVYDEDGKTVATDIEKIRWDDSKGQAEYGLIPFDDEDGNPALKKRPKTPTPVASPAEKKYEARTRKGVVRRLVTLKEGDADKNLMPKFKEGSTEVDYFQIIGHVNL